MNWPPPREDRAAREIDGINWMPGKKFRVLRDGARLSGWQQLTDMPGSVGWRRFLTEGDVIECAGFGPGWGSDPGFGVEFRDPDVGLVEFYPQVGGAFNYRPEPGWLEPVD